MGAGETNKRHGAGRDEPARSGARPEDAEPDGAASDDRERGETATARDGVPVRTAEAAGPSTDTAYAGAAPTDRQPAPLDAPERRQLDLVRRFGTTGSLVLAFGAIGAGAAPVDNPLIGVRLLGLPARIPTVAMACAWLGMLMVVTAWLWLGKLSWPGRDRMVSRTQMDRTVVMWGLPLAIAPPLFSTDMYTYLAQNAVAALGINPYSLGPGTALGVDNPLVANVPNIWRDTPSPYGPLFLMFGQHIARVIGDDVVFGVLLWRVVMIIGLVLAIWAIPRLAARCGVHPVAALWLSAANPITLFHVVSGAHNEALLVGIMLAAIELGLRWRTPLGVIAAGVLLSIGGAIKPPGFVALGFFGIYVARRRGGRMRDLVGVAALLGAVLLVTMTIITVASGWGLGWIETYDVPNRIKTWLAPMTAFGMTGGGLGMLLGLGNHTNSMLVITKIFGYAITGGVCLRLLWLSFKGRIEPLAALGITLGTLAVFGPVLHPWYLLWMVVPLSLSTNDHRFRLGAAAICSIVALVVPPTGAAFLLRAYQIPFAVIASLIAFAVLLWLMRGKVPPLLPTRKGERPVTS
ncbi:polyprenol phosphomannose-dependent alpha 1,6 mannosyltransferase MptB [Saccharopolyspora sp. NFXS83]|uniref:polyprenol phosphomannose-dependent alpha 1,6 mannosyltransferase MptB n=1 Tax=Saccharopolyspora sp. NFXS83 TaxID=2993560 RepID=UPI00224B60EB|nr:polyprenol phosphomannose-dependent alpha 1,6 mannosyltransferase MptB [Saccharopolyspora sp. NFXS83]MCX2734090.1 polyprenol phosphomannose-dependent alpha 1,6 mannosyltransferase MptB [Saccharopolyspora sp. NFXS83]